MRRISVILTDDNDIRFAWLLAETGMNPNRLINTLITNAVVADVERREPVAKIEVQEARHESS